MQIDCGLRKILENKYNINDFSNDKIIVLSLSSLELYYLYLDIYIEYNILIPINDDNIFISLSKLEDYINNNIQRR